MGQLFSALSSVQFWKSWFPTTDFKVVMVGLDNAGKTTILYRLHLAEHVRTTPTIGSNVEMCSFENLTFEIWDLAGQANLRNAWAAYYTAANAFIVVADSTDRARVGILKQELFKALANEHLGEACLLIYANKQDLQGAMGVPELSERLDLVSIKTHNWHVQPSSALKGEGLLEGLRWIAEELRRKQQSPQT